jgi:hypothetical protein
MNLDEEPDNSGGQKTQDGNGLTPLRRFLQTRSYSGFKFILTDHNADVVDVKTQRTQFPILK